MTAAEFALAADRHNNELLYEHLDAFVEETEEEAASCPRILCTNCLDYPATWSDRKHYLCEACMELALPGCNGV